jgi:tetratricopeptide (TPR) repeat protein
MALFDSAITDYSSFIALRPKDADAYNNRAWAYYSMGDAARALDDANKALTIRPFDPDLLDTRGHVLEFIGRRDEAAADYQNALRFNPGLQGSRDGLKRLGDVASGGQNADLRRN